MNKQLYRLYELLLFIKAEVHSQSTHYDPATLSPEYWIDIRIHPDDPPMIMGPGVNLKRNFLIKLRPNA